MPDRSLVFGNVSASDAVLSGMSQLCEAAGASETVSSEVMNGSFRIAGASGISGSSRLTAGLFGVSEKEW